MFFHTVFVENENGEVYLDVLKNATANEGSECAFISQAFVLWHLQQFLEALELAAVEDARVLQLVRRPGDLRTVHLVAHEREVEPTAGTR